MPYDLSVRGWMPESDLKIIERWASEFPKNSILVEIGSLFGRSAICWARSLPEGSEVYCYDRWDGKHEGLLPEQFGLDQSQIELHNLPRPGDRILYGVFLENTEHDSNIHSQLVNCADDIKWNGPKINGLFLDTEHKNPGDWDYLMYWLERMQPGGWLMGHDYSEHFPVVIDNVRWLEKMVGKKAEVIKTLWRLSL